MGVRWCLLSWACVWGVLANPTHKGDRSSDPHIQPSHPDPHHPHTVSDLPLGKLPTIETDVPGAPLTPSDFQNSAAMGLAEHPSVDTNRQADPIELAGLFQGDIMLVPENQLQELATEGETRSAMTDVHRRWPNGIIPYVISQTYDESERATIAKAMSEYHDKTCIRFVPRTIERDYIHILKGDGCSSAVGRTLGAQQVSLGPGCLYVGIVMHEFMHTVGFWHEQSRSDRDNFIIINKDNVQDGMWYNFEKYGWDKIQSLGVGYDLQSIMHYGPYAFAKGDKPTIVMRTTGNDMGQRRGFSKRDVEKLQRLYNCANTTAFFVTNSTVPNSPSHELECKDNNEQYCVLWADRGECEANPVWMNVNCRKACKQCGKECQDNSVHCQLWMEAGECKNNSEYMNLFCKKSCGQCKDSVAAAPPVKRCVDKNRYCSLWALLNNCRTNPGYMMLYCRRSCNNCDDIGD